MDDKSNKFNEVGTMSNYCLSIAMPEARDESPIKRPYDEPVRPESLIDLNFKRTLNQKIRGLVAIAQMSNTLGKAFVVKKEHEFAIDALIAAKVHFIPEGVKITTYNDRSLH